jgi:hypothetical protein
MQGSDADMIDRVERNQRTDTWSLVMIHRPVRNGPEEQVDWFARKLERYRRFVVDGEMSQVYPESKAKPVCIEIHLYAEPRPAVAEIIRRVRERLLFYDIPVVVQKMGPDSPAGGGAPS